MEQGKTSSSLVERLKPGDVLCRDSDAVFVSRSYSKEKPIDSRNPCGEIRLANKFKLTLLLEENVAIVWLGLAAREEGHGYLVWHHKILYKGKIWEIDEDYIERLKLVDI